MKRDDLSNQHSARCRGECKGGRMVSGFKLKFKLRRLFRIFIWETKFKNIFNGQVTFLLVLRYMHTLNGR
jgi:hypothetical protein